ncbi:hypothetical protein GWC77_26930 [Paraburkholderia sp. NMBU_R16]|uniref:hypothetical protein n=1 Tax=Paraburkholderia sp. NMBU_R16 TaxID=2698676 RepID=UPI001564458A|nr:hypothetical protein [Paraburkholderia sp. NMBU_R16]NRO99510.1 hypothetical protein [Paraburkholderia sp. NMBU_R16]
MAHRRNLTANSTQDEIDAHARELEAAIAASLRTSARPAATEPHRAAQGKMMPRTPLEQFAPENIERLLRIIESAPTKEQLQGFMKRVDRSSGRRCGVGLYARRALAKCTDYYAKQHPGCDPENLSEVIAIRRFIRQQRSDLAADIWDIRRNLRHLQDIASAKAELQAIKEEFNKLGNDDQSTTP